MKRLLGIVVIVTFVVVFGLFNASKVYATTVIKFQSVYPQTSFITENLIFFADKVKEYTNGEVEVKLYWPGQLVKTQEAFSALQRGMIDGLAVSAQYAVGFMPEGNGEWLPSSWENKEAMIDIYFNHGFLDLIRTAAAQHDIRYVAPLACGSMGLLTKFPVHKMEDLKGKKIKTAGMSGDIMMALGATPVTISQSEQYMALQRGTIDGIYYPWYPIETYKFYEVITHIIQPAFHTPSLVPIWLSGKVWDGLSSANKDAINRAGKEAMLAAAAVSDAKDERALRFSEEKGVGIIRLSPEEEQRFWEKVMGTYETHAKKSALCAKQVEIIKKYRKEKGN